MTQINEAVVQVDVECDSTKWEYLVAQCSNVKDYVRILMNFSEDGVFNEGRKKTITNYTMSVAAQNPHISHEIIFILDLFINKFKSTSWICTII